MSPGGRTATGKWADHTAAQLRDGPADCVGVKLAPRETFLRDPPIADPTKPVFWDNDHGMARLNPCPHGIPWMAFTRAYHFVLYDHPFESPADESDAWERARFNIGATVEYARRFRDLSRMNPHNRLASTGYCLANPGRDYLVYLPAGGNATVDLWRARGTMSVEWFNPADGKATTAKATRGGRPRTFTAPFPGDAVLYLVALS